MIFISSEFVELMAISPITFWRNAISHRIFYLEIGSLSFGDPVLSSSQLLASIILLAAISNTTAISDSSMGNPLLFPSVTSQADRGDPGFGQKSSDSLQIYEEYYNLNPGDVYASGPVQFEIHGSEPSYLIIDGQSRPYDFNYVPSNSLWIQGRTSWTQYIKCPLGARFKMLAYSDGGPTTMIETYPDGYQDVQQYRFYRGYTQLVFLADEIGRHTLVFYGNGRQSNEVVVDVVRGSGTSIPSGGAATGTAIIDIGSSDQGFGQPQGKSCDITGTWRFQNGYSCTFYSDGRAQSRTAEGELYDSGTWYAIDASKRQYGGSWQSGWKSRVTLSEDCSAIKFIDTDTGGSEKTFYGARTVSGSFSGNGGILIDSADQGFDPTATVQGYDDPYGQLPEIFIDSAEDGFDPTAPPLEEMI